MVLVVFGCGVSEAHRDKKRVIAKLKKRYECCIVGTIGFPYKNGDLYIQEVESLWVRDRPRNYNDWLHIGTSQLFRPGMKVVCLVDYDKKSARLVCILNKDGTVKLDDDLSAMSIDHLKDHCRQVK